MEDAMNDIRLDRRAPTVLLVLALVSQALSCDRDPGTGPQPPETGTLRVQASTTGPAPFLVYFVGIDGKEEVVPVNGAADFRLSSGAHRVHLSNAEPRCSVAGDNPRTVTVPAGAVISTRFDVTCPLTGAIEVTVSTTGVDPDPDGYLVTLNGSQSQHIGVSASVVFSGVAAGEQTVELSGLEPNCSVGSDNPRSVAVSTGETARTTFAIVCTGTTGGTGSISVTASTTGVNLDPDGYTVVVRGDALGGRVVSQPISSNATAEIPGLAPGDYELRLSDLAPNCLWASSLNAVQVATVSAGSAAKVTFHVTCFDAPLGTLRVRTSTTGSPPFFYLIGIDNRTVGGVGVNGAADFRLSAGSHKVSLQVGTSCSVADNPRTVQVISGATVEAAFKVTC
jgi:hypothetical protein